MASVPGSSFDMTAALGRISDAAAKLQTEMASVGSISARSEAEAAVAAKRYMEVLTTINTLLADQIQLQRQLQYQKTKIEKTSTLANLQTAEMESRQKMQTLEQGLAIPGYYTPKQQVLAQRQYENLQKEVLAREAATKAEEGRVGGAVAPFEAGLVGVGTNITALRENAKTVKKELKDVKKVTDDAGDSAMNMGERFNIALKKIITYRIAFGIYRTVMTAMEDSIQKTREFNDVIQDLKKVLDPSGDSVQKLSEAAFDLGEIYGKSAKEVAGTFSIFAQQGLSVNQILERTNAVLKLSATSAISAMDAVQALTAVVEAYPEFMDNATSAVDKWAAVQAKAPSTTQDLANAMMRVGIAAKEVGVTFDQFNGIVSSINEVSRRSGKEIGNSLKTMFANIASEDAIIKLKRLGIAVMETQQTFRPVGDVIFDIREKWDKWTNSQRVNAAQIIGDKRRYTDFLALMENYSRYISSTIDSMTAQGEAGRMLQFETEKYNRKLEALNTNISRLKIALGEELMPVFIWFYKILAKAATIMRTNATLFGVLTGATGILATAFGVLKVISWAVTANLERQAAATKALELAEATGSVMTAKFAGKLAMFSRALGWVGLAISAVSLVALIYNLIKGSKATTELEDSINKTAKSLETWETAQLKVIKSVKQTREEIKKLAELNKEKRDLEIIQERIRYYEDYAATRVGIERRLNILNQMQAESQNEVAKAYERYQKSMTTANYEAYMKVANRYTEVIAGAKKELEQYGNMSFETVGKRVMPVRTEEERKQVLAEFLKLETESLDRMNKLINTGSKTWVPKTISEYLKRLYEVNSEYQVSIGAIDNVILKLNEAKAKNLGESFAPNEEQLRVIASMYEAIVANRKEYETTLKTLKDLQATGIFANELENDKLKQVEEIEKLEKERAEITRRETELKQLLETAGQRYVALLIKQKEEQNKIFLNAQKTSNMYDLMIQLNQMEGKGLQKLSSMRGMDFVNLAKIIEEEKTVLDLKEAQVRAQADAESKAAKTGTLYEAYEADLQRQADLQKKLLEIEAERQKVDIQVYSNAAKLVKNLQSEIAAAFSESFTKMPDALTEASKTIKNINKERLEAEDDLKNARAKNDADAMKEASKRLNDLRNQMKEARQDQIEAFTNIFGDVGNVAIQKWGEQFSRALFTDKTAEFLASGIVPAGLQTAQIWYDTIMKAMNDSKNIPGAASSKMNIETGADGVRKLTTETYDAAGNLLEKTSNNLETVGTDIGNKWKQALEAGGNLAAVAIIKAMGIGVGEISNALGNFGAMLGAAAGEKWLSGGAGALASLGSFAGPVGTIIGSLLGAGIGSLLEKDPVPYIDKNTEATKSNTTAVENNNQLLSLQREFINAPTNYAPSTLYGMGTAGAGGMAVTININGSGNASSVANEVVRQIDAAYSSSARRMQTQYSRFGR